MSWILNIIYAVCLVVCSPWLAWRSLFQGKSRRGWSHKLLGRVPHRPSNTKCIWIHAVSVGEVNLLAPLILALQRMGSSIEVVVSTTTETGYDLARKKHPELNVFFCPMDFSWAVRRTLARIKPDLLVLTELELWPNLVLNARAFGAKVMIANARLSESSFRGYKRCQFLIRPILRSIHLVAAQNEEYTNRFILLGCGAEQVCTTGSIKFDNARFNRHRSRTAELAGLLPDRTGFVFLAGSTQPDEDALMVDTYRRLVQDHPELQLILVPRHPDRCRRLAQHLKQVGLSYRLRSVLRSQIDITDETRPNPVLIVDVIGELGTWWGVADAGYVGGSMGSRGGQNMIEPAAFGIPVSFGPRTENFRDVVRQLRHRDAAVVVSNQIELESFVRRAIVDPDWAQSIGQRAQQLVLAQQGATGKTAKFMIELLEDQPPVLCRAA